jgi:methylthioribose-1-phosphate isomerase
VISFAEALAPLRFTDGALELIDQRRLPDEEVWLRCTGYAEVAVAIRDMAIRGAPAIGCAAAYGVVLGALAGADAERVAQTLAATRPTAVNLFWALARMAKVAPRTPERLLAEARAIHEEDLAACVAIGEHGAPLLPDGVVLTIITDNMAAHLMQRGEIQSVIVGADRIAKNGDTANKIGTYAVALAAREHRLPFFVAAPRSTIDLATPSGDAIPIEERAAVEVTHLAGRPVAPRGVAVRNPAFDVTPAALISAIVTEAGVARPPYGESLPQLFAEVSGD